MPRKSKKQIEEETSKVDVKVEEKTEETSKVDVKGSDTNLEVNDGIDNTEKSFLMDISDYGDTPEDAEKFVKMVIKEHFDNKVKNIEVVETQTDPLIYDKIKKFEDSIRYNQFVPRKTIDNFLKTLK